MDKLVQEGRDRPTFIVGGDEVDVGVGSPAWGVGRDASSSLATIEVRLERLDNTKSRLRNLLKSFNEGPLG